MAKSENLTKAKENKNDEFYTLYEDVQSELNHYEKHFEGKTILCNCDDPFESNFCKFFLRNFNYLKLKRLICTSYKASSVAGTQLSFFDLIEDTPSADKAHGYVLDVSKVPMANGRGISDSDIDKLLRSKKNVKELKGDGDFRSDECIEYLKQADIVVTNPPFSLARNFINTLFEYSKQFLIVGDLNWTSNKDVFSYMQDNKMWMGYTSPKTFIQPNGSIKKFGNKLWFTNLDIKKRHEKLILFKHYNEDDYPHYDNYDAIEVSKVSDIPVDYDKIMGVPITFLDHYNPEQFEILGRRGDLEWAENECDFYTPPSPEKQAYYKSINKTWRVQNTYILSKDGIPQITYARIFIRRKE